MFECVNLAMDAEEAQPDYRRAMNRARLLTAGLLVLIAGLAALAVGTLVGSHDLVIGLILLLIVPLATVFCGAVLALIGLARQPVRQAGSPPTRQIIGMVALAGLGAGSGYPALATLSQLPDYASGINGAFLPPTFLEVVLLPATGLALGLVAGSVIAVVSRSAERRRGRSTAAAAAHPQ